MTLIRTEREGHVAILTIERAESGNVLGRAGDGEAFRAACHAVNIDHSIKCVILTGAGKVFSGGGDLKAMKERSGAFAAEAVAIREGYRRDIHQIVHALYGLEVPTIAAVNGAAIGLGCDVACMADIRIASVRATFGATFLKIGLVPGDGGAWLLPRIIGMSRACELLYSAKVIDAMTAERWGLISHIVEPEKLLPEALVLAESIAAQPAHALRLTKSLLRHGQNASYDTIMEMSASAQAIAHLTDDHMEGVEAMLEKRPPHFMGR